MKIKSILMLFFLQQFSPVFAGSTRNSVYLDYAASHDISEDAIKAFDKVSKLKGNSSGINPHSKQLRGIEKIAAEVIAKKIKAKSQEQILFTNSASMSNNIAILGVARGNPKCHMITSKIEHKGVLKIFKHLEEEGHKVTYLDVDEKGVVDLSQLEQSLKNNGNSTKLISIQTLNSEIGTIQPIEKIGKIAEHYGCLFHSDASQSFGKYEIDVDDLKIDLLTISGHKIGAPKGIAALYIRDRSTLSPILFGSGDNLFPGSRPTALFASFAAAVNAFKFNKKKIDQKCRLLVRELRKLKGIFINSPDGSHIVSVSISGVLLRDLLERMKMFSFSAGCSCIGMEQSNVLSAINQNGKRPTTCTIRLSFSDKVKDSDLISFAKNLKNVVEKLRTEKSVSQGCESGSLEGQKDLSDYLENIFARNSS